MLRRIERDGASTGDGTTRRLAFRARVAVAASADLHSASTHGADPTINTRIRCAGREARRRVGDLARPRACAVHTLCLSATAQIRHTWNKSIRVERTAAGGLLLTNRCRGSTHSLVEGDLRLQNDTRTC